MQYDSTSIPSKYRHGRALSRADRGRWKELIQEFIRPEAGAPLIDLGCGTGRFTGLLSEVTAAAVIGLDPSREMLREAVEDLPDKKVAFVHGRRAKRIWQFGAGFKQAAVEEMMAVLGPALKAFADANQGREPTDPSQLAPYLRTKEQRLALENLQQTRDLFLKQGVAP